MADLGESRLMIAEATTVFRDGLDAAALKKCVQEEVELRSSWKSEESDARALIKALTAKLEETSSSVVKLESPEEHETILQTLDKNKLELAKKANSAETTVAEKKAEIRRLEAAIAAMQAEIESGAHEVTVSNPQIEHELTLYGMISSIQWMHPEEGAPADAKRKLQGTTNNKELGQLRSFNLDTTRQSDQWIADYLWSMVSPVA